MVGSRQHRFGRLLLIVAVALVCPALEVPAESALGDRNADLGSSSTWTVEDNIGVGDVSSEWPDTVPFSYSPDGSLIAFVTKTSDLKSDELVSRLRVFRVRDFQHFASGGSTPLPVFELEARNRESGPGISSLQWSSDGRELFFLTRRAGKHMLAVWQVGNPAHRPVLESEMPIPAFNILDNRTLGVFISRPAANRIADAASGPVVATGRSLVDLLGLQVVDQDLVRSASIEIVDWPTGRRSQYEVRAIPLYGFARAPHGNRLIFAEELDAAWGGHCWRRTITGGAGPLLPAVQAAILDWKEGRIVRPLGGPIAASVLIDAAMLFSEFAVWSPEGSKAIVPMAFRESDMCPAKGGMHFPAAYSFGSDGSNVQLVRPFPFDASGQIGNASSKVSWEDARTITWETDTEATPSRVTYELGGNGWQQNARSINRLLGHAKRLRGHAKESSFVLAIRQAHDSPPAIVAQSPGGGRRDFEDLAPHARRPHIGRTQEVSWYDDLQRKWSGILTTPDIPDARPPYPLIIQTHGFPQGFFAEGISTSAFPGRAAVGRGYAVLTINDTGNPNITPLSRMNSPEEAKLVLGAYRSAIAYLQHLDMIDAARVGIIGWSRTAYYVKYALTHDPALFRAAVVADGLDYGYLQYLLYIDYVEPTFKFQYTRLYGGTKLSTDKGIRNAPGFVMDEFSTPLRIEAYSTPNLLGEWEFYAAARQRDLPVDLILYPRAYHSLMLPSERRQSQEGSLDWFDFWMKGREDPDPAKKGQYARWEQLCDLQGADNAVREGGCVSSQFH